MLDIKKYFNIQPNKQAFIRIISNNNYKLEKSIFWKLIQRNILHTDSYKK